MRERHPRGRSPPRRRSAARVAMTLGSIDVRPTTRGGYGRRFALSNTPAEWPNSPVCRAVCSTSVRSGTWPRRLGNRLPSRKRILCSHVCHAGCSACFVAVPSAVRDHTDADITFIGMVRGITETERRTTCPVAKARTRQSPPRPPRRLGPGRTETGGRISWTCKFSTNTRPTPIRWTRTSTTRDSSRPSTWTR